MNVVKQDSLNICIGIAKILYRLNPSNGMPIKNNSIVAFTTKGRLCNNSSMSNDAHYHNTTPHRICVRQKFLQERHGQTCEYQFGHVVRGTFTDLFGNFAIIELICHETAHHRTKGHGKIWYAKYNKQMTQMALLIISGDLYKQETWQ